MKKLVLVAALASASIFAFVGCSSDTPKNARPTECEALIELCHPSVSTAGQECHESAEGVWTAAECTAHTAECTTICTPDAGTP